MKKLLVLLMSFGLVFSAYAGNQWRVGTTAKTIPGATNISDIDEASYEDMTAPLDRLLSNFRENCVVSYASTSTVTVGAGEIVLQNSAGTITLMQQNAAATTVTWGMIDTGSEAASTTYYLWAYQATATDTDFDVTISTSSSAPSGKTYYARLGSFYNNASSNILNDNTIVNDNETAAKQLGDWVAKSNNVSYLAATDGFVTCYESSGGAADSLAYGYTDISNPPTTRRAFIHGSGSCGTNQAGLMMPVKKGNYWKVTVSRTAAVYWIPLG